MKISKEAIAAAERIEHQIYEGGWNTDEFAETIQSAIEEAMEAKNQDEMRRMSELSLDVAKAAQPQPEESQGWPEHDKPACFTGIEFRLTKDQWSIINSAHNAALAAEIRRCDDSILAHIRLISTLTGERENAFKARDTAFSAKCSVCGSEVTEDGTGIPAHPTTQGWTQEGTSVLTSLDDETGDRSYFHCTNERNAKFAVDAHNATLQPTTLAHPVLIAGYPDENTDPPFYNANLVNVGELSELARQAASAAARDSASGQSPREDQSKPTPKKQTPM